MKWGWFMRLPMFSSYLYDDREYSQIILSELELLLYINTLDSTLSKLIFDTLEYEEWRLARTINTLIAIVVSVLLNEDLEDGYDYFYVPITNKMAMMLLGCSTEEFKDFFISENLHPCFDRLVSSFFYDFESVKYHNTGYSFYSCWYDIEFADEDNIEEFDIPFSDFVKTEILQFDESNGCYFLKMDFQYVSPDMISETFFNVYDQDYLFKIGVLNKEEDYEKRSRL